MFSFFQDFFQGKTKNHSNQSPNQYSNFDYLNSKKDYYFDSACTTLRFAEVVNNMNEYFFEYNSCGHRAKYKWADKTTKLVDECRQTVLDLVGKSNKDYMVVFNLNTTAGINQVVHQLPQDSFDQIVISEIEHNSVFLPSLTWTNRHQKKRLVLGREDNELSPNFGGLVYESHMLDRSVVLLNTHSNIDGRILKNLPKIATDVKNQGGLLLLDACQTLGHQPEFLKDIQFDACFGSGHKMYGPSVGFIIIKKSLLQSLNYYMLGGSTVQDVGLDSYELAEGGELYTRLEAGLQNYAGIIGLQKAIRMRNNFRVDYDPEYLPHKFKDSKTKNLSASEYENLLAEYLNQELLEIENISLLNSKPSPVVSLHSDKIDSHKLGIFLAEQGIMCRTGYHCCHYYLKSKLDLPPLFRISLGLNNTPEQIDFLIKKLKLVLENY